METELDSREKKQEMIFLLIAFGVTWLMSILMYVGLKEKADLTSLVNAQMFYPACGVMIAKMSTKRKEEKIPLGGYIVFIVGTLMMMVVAALSVLVPIFRFPVLGSSATIDQVLTSYLIILISVPVYIIFWTCNKEARENAGVVRKNIKWSVIMILLFVVLYFARFAIGNTFEGLFGDGVVSAWKDWLETMGKAINEKEQGLPLSAWSLSTLVLPINFFFSFSAFFGEEYGWRYFLQPIMQKKYGKKQGVLLLGLIWGVWHVCVDFMFYTTSDGPQMFITQLITCLSMGIFLGYAYMKTQNIWVPVIMHYLNNNLILVITGTADASILQNQAVSWKDIPIAIIQSLVFALFIFAKEYKEDKKMKI